VGRPDQATWLSTTRASVVPCEGRGLLRSLEVSGPRLDVLYVPPKDAPSARTPRGATAIR